MIINEKNYEEVLKGLSVVEVSGEGCANCISLLPIVNKLVGSRTDCELHHIELTEETLPLMEKFGVQAVPTILILYNQDVYAKCRGYQPEEILEVWLDAKIDELKSKNGIN